MNKTKHWTSRSDDAFAHAIASDFVAQIETVMETEGIERKTLAEKIHVTPGRVSQVLNNPATMNLRTVVKYSRAVNRKVALVTYDDGDKENNNGPIDAGVFSGAWEQAGCPNSLFDLSGEGVVISYGFVVCQQAYYKEHSLKKILPSEEVGPYQGLGSQIKEIFDQQVMPTNPKAQEMVIYAQNS